MLKLITLIALIAGIDYYAALLYLSGASTLEELSEDEIELYDDLAKHPLDLNHTSRSKLLSCGLFTQFQVASILDYRKYYGDIMSLAELSLIDGFNPSLVDALSYFIEVGSSRPASHRDTRYFKQDIVVGAALRTEADSGDPEYNYRVKYHAEIGSAAELFWTSRTSYSSPEPQIGTISAAVYGSRHLGKMVLGHYSARFGQGLNQWSGFSLSGYSSISAFNKRASGIAATGSATAQKVGFACDWQLGDFSLAGAYDFEGQSALAHLDWSGRNLTLGTTISTEASSIDWRYGFGDMSIYGEASWHYRARLATQCSALWAPEYGRNIALQLRYYHPDYKEYSGVALGYEGSNIFASIDASERGGEGQYKILAQYKFLPVQVDSLSLVPLLRLNLRYRPSASAPLRIDARVECQASIGRMNFALRYNALWCRAFAHMAYLQASRKAEKLSLSARVTLYKVDNWDDRIYVYEQDAPGTFNVPALYGRGWKASIFGAWHINKSHSLWLRLEYRPDRTELKLQYRWR